MRAKAIGHRSYRRAPRKDARAYYDDPARAAGLSQLYSADTPLGRLYRVRVERILEALEVCTGGSLLDIGCGPGEVMRSIAERRGGDFTFTGLDRSPAMIDIAESALGGRARLVVACAEQLPLDADAYDVALGIGVLEYVVDVAATLREISRVLRSGGLAIVTMQNRWSPYRVFDAAIYRYVRLLRGEPESPIVGRVGEARLKQMLGEAGLRPVDVVYYDFNVVPPPLDRRLGRSAMWLADRLEHLGRSPLRHAGTGFIVTARNEPS